MNTDRIEKKVVLRAPLDRVWRAITDSAEFGLWFGVKFDSPFRPGAAMHGQIVGTTVDPEVAQAQQAHKDVKFSITIEQIVPQRLFSFRWHPNDVDPNVDASQEPTTLVSFALAEVAGGVELTVTESGFDQIPLARRAKAFGANERGWEIEVRMISEYLAHAA
jgi:uncharacterized protein YndB with AHSA1/START domain